MTEICSPAIRYGGIILRGPMASNYYDGGLREDFWGARHPRMKTKASFFRRRPWWSRRFRAPQRTMNDSPWSSAGLISRVTRMLKSIVFLIPEQSMTSCVAQW